LLLSFVSTAHHAFFWLLGFREALIVVEGLAKKGKDMKAIMDLVRESEEGYDKKHVMPSSSKGYHIPDQVQW
jgi:hypothetical protein